MRSSYTPELGKNKQLLYREAHKRIKRAIKKGSHIEAIALLESIMSDRIESAISVVTGKQVNVSSLGKWLLPHVKIYLGESSSCFLPTG
jgi:hypothetical protein